MKMALLLYCLENGTHTGKVLNSDIIFFAEYFPNPMRQENESSWRRFTDQQEVIPDNCTCALMEKEFLKMAEHAYKNIRRQDGSTESFVRFQKELSETNAIINESLSVLKNMKSICEHRHLNKY